MHCAQAGLSDLNADCSSQDAIECSDRSRLEPGVGRPLCFSRQMVSKEENIGVEKMCVMEKDVIQEYGKHAMEMLRAIDENGVKCAVVPINGLNSTFCICANSLCNRPPIIDQQQV